VTRTLTLAFTLALASTLAAQPQIKVPTLPEVLAGDMVAKAKIRWSKVKEGKRIAVTIRGGEAERLEPFLSEKPGRLKYDLDKNRALVKAIRAARLGPSQKHLSESDGDRSLEILVDGPTDWVVVGRWSFPEKTWEKKQASLYEHLEPRMKMQLDVFNTMPGPER